MPRRMVLPYLNSYTVRGRVFTYYRRDGQRIRIRGILETPEWLAEYNRIHGLFERDGGGRSLSALIERYRASPEFSTKALRTRRDYEAMLLILDAKFGRLPVATMPRAFAFELRDLYAATPRKANYLIQVLRILMSFAVDRGWRPDNPLANWKGMLEEGGGWRGWTTDEVATFRGSAAPELRLALELALHTGQRQADLLRMAWSQYDGRAVEVTQSKTGARLWIPAHRDLRRALDATKRRATVILTSPTGLAWTQNHFKKSFRKAIADAKLGGRGLTFHGLRRTATARLADAGCTEREIMAITGHKTAAMVSHYLEDSTQRARASAAIEKLERAGRGRRRKRRSNKSD